MIKIDKALVDLGLKAASIDIRGLSNGPTPPELRAEIESRVAQFVDRLTGQDIQNLTAIGAYKTIYSRAGIPRSVVRPSIERMVSMIMKGKPTPAINVVVDIYNLQSLEQQMCMGAHDLGAIQLPVTLQLVRGGEIFTPLGGEPESMKIGEYAYFDRVDTIICRDNAVQGHASKVNAATRDVFLIVECPAIRSDDELLSAAADTAAMVKKYAGGVVSEPLLASPIDQS